MAAGLERPQVVSHAQQALSYTLFDCKWVPRSARLLCLGSAARGSGLLQLYELRGGRLALLREVRPGRGEAGGKHEKETTARSICRSRRSPQPGTHRGGCCHGRPEAPAVSGGFFGEVCFPL